MNDDGFWLFRGLDTKFSFREATLSRIRQPSTRLQVLLQNRLKVTLTIRQPFMTAIAHHRVNTYFVALDIVIGEIKERFTVDDQDILCALGDVVFNLI